MESAKSYLITPATLPDAVFLHILSLSSSAIGSSIARQVCRATHEDALKRTVRRSLDVPAYDPELPLWLLKQMWPGTHSFFKPKLLEAR